MDAAQYKVKFADTVDYHTRSAGFFSRTPVSCGECNARHRADPDRVR